MSGWTYDVEKPLDKDAHGLTLKNVAHDGHSFANEIGVAAIWINPNEDDGGTKHRPFVLCKDDFSLVGGIRDVKTAAVPPFNGYKLESAIRQTYTLKVIENDPVLGNEFFPLAIEQTYRFSKYGVDPPHEPSGQLPAARIFPYVTFSTFNPKIRRPQAIATAS